MFKKTALWIVTSCLVFFGAYAGIPGGHGTNSGPQFSRQKGDVDSMLGQLESLVNRVNARKIITVEDDVDINRLLDEYPEKMNALDEEASKNQQSKQQFVELVTAHQRRVKALQSKLQSMESQAKAAKIVPDRSLLQSFSSAGLQKYKSFLSSEGLSRMRQMYPEIFNRQPNPEPLSQATGIMSGPNSDATSGEFYGASAGSSAAAAGCWSKYLSCRSDCNSQIWLPKWLCKCVCFMEYLICKY
jgi:hypothetical protein